MLDDVADAERRELISPESRAMLEGVIRMADLTAGDVMVAEPRMDLLDIAAPYDELLDVIQTRHSRFPVRIDNWCHSDGLSAIYSRILESNLGGTYPQIESWNWRIMNGDGAYLL